MLLPAAAAADGLKTAPGGPPRGAMPSSTC